MTTQSHRVGRAFDDPRKPLGYDVLERTMATHDLDLLANRTKAIAVLRKAEEFLYTHNPGPSEPGGVRRALELAAGRVGLTYDEFSALVRGDSELEHLEREVVDDARARG
jgi:hypothetical protein